MTKPCAVSCLFLCCALYAQSQEQANADSLFRPLDQVVVSYNRWEVKRNEVPNRILKIDLRDAAIQNPQTAADMLSLSGRVFVQKSQMGGGSPMVRGFSANRLLLSVDGVRMNNAIFRSGNLHNIIAIDPFSIGNAEVMYGPGSIIYGSDAIGGVIDFRTLPAPLSANDSLKVTGGTAIRHSSANNEKTIHADIGLGKKKWALLTSFTWSDFGDLRMGRRNGWENYLRREYVQTGPQGDAVVSNQRPHVQARTGYSQRNLLQKARYRPSDHLELQYTLYHATTGDMPRYDRLIQYRQGRLRFAEWDYGPMLWNMHHLQASHDRKNILYDRSRLVLAFQDYRESRTDRALNSPIRNTQSERVEAWSLNWDARKSLEAGTLNYGVELVLNRVASAGMRTELNNGVISGAPSRYPDGSRWNTAGAYVSRQFNTGSRTSLSTGLRYTHGGLRSEFDTQYVRYPYREVESSSGALTGSLGAVFRPAEGWQFNGMVSTGFRYPNIDDIGKTFESTPGRLTVPNPGLRSEYIWNLEAGIVYTMGARLRLELNAFQSLLNRAIVRRPFSFNGSDSILFNGTMLGVEALQNASFAKAGGIEASVEWRIDRTLTLETHLTWTEGSESDEASDARVPLRHAPPVFGMTRLQFAKGPIRAELAWTYNGRILADDLPPTERAKPEIYASDGLGRPWSPSWNTVNLRTAWQMTKGIQLTASWENMTDRMYRTYSSGIVSPGSQVVVSGRFRIP